MSVITLPQRTLHVDHPTKPGTTGGRTGRAWPAGRAIQPAHPGRVNRMHGGATAVACSAVRTAPATAAVQERRMVVAMIAFALLFLVGAVVAVSQFISVSSPATQPDAGQPASVAVQR